MRRILPIFFFIHTCLATCPAGAQEAVSADLTVEPYIVQIILNDEHRDGVDWGAIVSDYHTAALKKEDNPVWADKTYKISVGTISNDDYDVLVEALDTVGRATAFAQAPVGVAFNASVQLDLKLFPLDASQQVQDDPQFNMHIKLATKSLKAEVLLLEIEPHLTLMTIESKGSSRLPVVLPLKANTEVDLKDNTTIVVGGVIKEEQMTKTRKFPLLGSLPILGLVFRSHGRWVQRTETIIFLKTHMKVIEISEEKTE